MYHHRNSLYIVLIVIMPNLGVMYPIFDAIFVVNCVGVSWTGTTVAEFCVHIRLVGIGFY